MSKSAGEGEAADLGIAGLEDAEFVGRGGSAVVYKAEQVNLHRTVAVKLLTSSWDEAIARRFDREQRAMGRLSNRPGIVPVYESGLTTNGVPYIVMPFYADGSLKDWSSRQGPVTWQRATEIILDVAEAVGRAHDEGIVHRDLKPANVLLSSTGRPLLADFGLARLASDETGVATTAVTFTPAYCPPEVLDEADPAPTADTYALAATFWALVQGRPPFTDSDTVLAMDAVLKRVLTEPVGRLDGVPTPITSFIERSMSKDPADRPSDGQAFADELREAVASSAAVAQTLDNDETVAVTLPTDGREVRPSLDAAPQAGRRLVLAAAVILLTAVAAVAAVVLKASGDEVAETSDLAGPSAGPEVVTVEPGQTIRLLSLAADPLASDSVQARRAAELAIRNFGPIGDFDVELLPTIDIACEPRINDSVRADIETTGAVVIVGSTCPVAAAPVMEAASRRGISWISSDLRAPNLTAEADGSEGTDHTDGFFRTAQNDHFQGAIAAQFAIDDLAADTALIIRGEGPGQRQIADSFAAVFAQAGDVTVLELADETDVADVAAASLGARPDVTFWILDSATAVDLAIELERRAAPASDRIAVENILSAAAVLHPAMADVFVVTSIEPTAEASGALGRTFEELNGAYAEQYGEAPGDSLAFASAYDATILALESVEATAVITADEMAIDRLALRNHLESARSDGLTGSLVCNFFGDCGSQAMAVVQIDGESVATTRENVVKFFGRAS